MSAVRVLANNCVSEIKVPKDVESAHTVDYNPVLGLYATVIVSVVEFLSGTP